MGALFERLTSPSFYQFLIERMVIDWRPKEPDRISITEISGCLRSAWFRRMKPIGWSGSEAVNLFLGRAIHVEIQRLLQNHIYEVDVEKKVEARFGEFTVVGKCDLIVRNNDGEEVVLELKTCKEIPSEPYKSHVRQLKYYQALLNLENGVIVYIDKVGRIRCFPSIMQDRHGWLEELKERASALYRCLKTRRRPRPEKGAWCANCPWKLYCLLK